MQLRPDAATATAAPPHAADADDASFMTLRWVVPSDNRVTVLAQGALSIGRDAAATVRIDTAQVSRQHAEVSSDARGHTIRDLGSKNGVFVNAERIKSAELGVGDVVRLGDAVAIVERISSAGLPGFGELAPGIYGGALMRSVVARAKTAAEAALNVVLLGETGTGKECFARAVHSFSGRSGPFLAVNCAAYDESTVVAELFGYRKGAFTGADTASPGHLRAADGGTLFLDEVLELSPSIQAKLLRAIEQKEVLSLGETRPRSVDVRFLCASQETFANAVRAGRFRTDLRSRLEGMIIELPNLSARRADVVPLLLRLLARHGYSSVPRIEGRLAERLCLYDWPMNVRELENVARRIASTHSARTELTLDLVRDCLNFEDDAAPRAAGAESRAQSSNPYAQEEIERLQEALARHGGNVTRAAEELGMTRPRVYRMLRAAALKA